jgi:ribosomal protein S18 acetylase RimI-like enzyme
MAAENTTPFDIRPFTNDRHRQRVIALWQQVFSYDTPHNDPGLSIDRKCAVADGLFWVALTQHDICGTIMAGYDGHRGWLYSLAVRTERRGVGIGAALVSHAEKALIQLGCLKVNLQITADNAMVEAFYQTLGYRVEPRISLGKILKRREPV